MPSGFVDQVIVCTKCDWCGVESTLADEGEEPAAQLPLL
jgi:hypothetical protein